MYDTKCRRSMKEKLYVIVSSPEKKNVETKFVDTLQVLDMMEQATIPVRTMAY